MKRILLVPLVCITSLFAVANTTKRVQRSVGYLENKGQIKDQNNNPNPAVKYLFNGNGLNVQLTNNGFSYDSYTLEQSERVPLESANRIPGTFKDSGKKMLYHYHRVDVEFIGANAAPEIIAEQPIENYTNYYTSGTGSDGILNVKTYQQVTYKNLYNGIDLQFTVNVSSVYGKAAGAKYNFIIHPGADVAQIKWKYKGAFRTELKNGKINLFVEQGDLSENIPASFIDETGIPMTVNYLAFDYNTFGFAVPDYNKQTTLVIDPVPWATYYGGSIYDVGNGIAIDTGGNLVVTGYTGSTTVIATAGAYQTSYGGNLDVFIAKFSPSGARLWGTYYGGGDMEIATGIATDKAANIVLTGYTTDSVTIATTGTHQATYGGGTDAFIAKFNPAGARLWGTYYGGTEEDHGSAIAIDTSGNIVITGYTASASGIATPGAHQATYGGGWNYDAFVAKFSSSGAIIWGTYYGTSGNDNASGIATDYSGNIFIIGTTNSLTGISTTGGFQPSYGGGTNSFVAADAFVVKFNGMGARLWGTYYGGSSDEVGQTIAIGASGNVYIAGWSTGTGMATVGAYQVVGGTFNYAYTFLAKFTNSGTRIWSTYYGTYNAESCTYGIAVDQNENILITGYASTPTGGSALVSNGAAQPTFGGGSYDAFIAKFTASGSRVWGTYYGGAGGDFASGITTDLSGNVFLTGTTSSDNAIATRHAYQHEAGGSDDVFISAFTAQGRMLIVNNEITASPIICGGSSSPLSGSVPNGGVGNYTYLWQQSTTGPNTGFTDAIGVNTTQNYTPPILAVTTWFRRVVFSGTESDTSSVFTITVHPPKFSGYTINNTAQCLNANRFEFNDTSLIGTAGVTRIWNFGGGPSDTSTLAQPTKIYTIPGTYTVKLVSLANGTCSDSALKVIVVFAKPNAGFTINNPKQCLSGNSFSVIDTSTISSGTLSRLWTFGDTTTSTNVNPNKRYLNAGSYSIKLMVTSNNNCVDSSSITVTVYNHPRSGFTVNNSAQCVNANRFEFNDTSAISIGGLTRIWNFGRGNTDTSTLVYPSKTYTIPGTYTVKLVSLADGACSDSASKIIVVFAKPNAGFTVNSTMQCLSGNSFSLHDTSNITSGTLSRLWTFGDTTTSTDVHPIKNYANTGSYQVKLKVTSDNYCVDSSATTVTVYNRPKSGFTINDTSQCLIGNHFFLEDSTSGIVSRFWNFGDLTSGTQDTIHKTYNTPGQYAVQLKVVDSHNCMDSIVRIITVKPNPAKPVITAISASQLQSTPALAYQWYNHSAIIPGAVSQVLMLTQNGLYTVEADSTNGCSNVSNPFNVSTVGMEQIFENNQPTMYPNPATDELLVSYASTAGMLFEVYDVNGKKVMSGNQLYNSTHQYRIDLKGLNKGFYFLLLGDQVYKFAKGN